MTVNCYPVPGKRKSLDICQAFADGCGGRVVTGDWIPGPSMFFGVTDGNQKAWESARASAFPWYYADNSYFDITRGAYFRVTKNRVQVDPFGKRSNGSRIPAGLVLQPLRPMPGETIVVCEQSPDFMRRIMGYQGDWLQDALRYVKHYSDKRIVVRHWNPDKAKLAQSLPAALEHAHCVVSHASMAAVEAVLAGVPIVVGNDSCAAIWSLSIAMIEMDPGFPPTPWDREEWAGILADNQWTLEEIRAGKAWAHLEGGSSAQGMVPH